MTRKPTVLWTDRILYEVRGSNAGTFLSQAARNGVHLSKISCTRTGYTVYVRGRDISRLQKAASATHAELHIRKRYGPGFLLEHLLHRPGLPVGLLLFFLLQGYLNGFVWNMDFGEMSLAKQNSYRTILSEYGIMEGSRISEETLRTAQETMETKMQDTGWLSLNFTAGCLFVEENEREMQTVRQPLEPQALYAKASGQVLSIELEGGFPEVAAGQYVAEGQLLANGQKADRSGQPVVQSAAGSIRGRMCKTYTCEQPLQTEVSVLNGSKQITESWQVLGFTWTREETALPAEAVHTVEWIPLQVGRIALPAILRRDTYWLKSPQRITYTEETAQALAARACCLQLLQEFPDADLESEEVSFEESDGASVTCTAVYTFCAEMSRSGPLRPLESTQSAS